MLTMQAAKPAASLSTGWENDTFRQKTMQAVADCFILRMGAFCGVVFGSRLWRELTEYST